MEFADLWKALVGAPGGLAAIVAATGVVVSAVGAAIAGVCAAYWAVYTWGKNEERKRSSDEYQRKEERYRELMRALRGFEVKAKARAPMKAAEDREAFLEQVKYCWLYCPDEVIFRAYAFLNTVFETIGADTPSTDQEKELAIGELMAAIRRDLLSRKIVKRTKLKARDWRHLSVVYPDEPSSGATLTNLSGSPET